jgi:predicted aspartyl protease
MILLEGKVNGDPVTFLLDTGSVGTIVSARMYRITPFPLRSVQRNADGHGINGESISVRLDLQLGNRRWAGQRVSIMNLDELSQILGIRHIDGLIGEDILREFRSIRIDYHTHVIELEE